MTLMSFFSKQFIDVIEWTDANRGMLAFKFPMEDNEIQNGAQLVVREAQNAIFFNEGKFADKFAPGTYTLTTQTLPVLTSLKNWDKAFQSPFKSDVYFFNLIEQTGQTWGTSQPITLRDKEFGPLRIRSFGSYAYKIVDIETFWVKLCGTSDSYSVENIESQLRSLIITLISTALGKGDIAFVDLAANQQQLSAELKDAIGPSFLEYGLALTQFFVQNLSLPEELEKHLDRASSMRIVGDAREYMQFQLADSIPAMAANSGGAAAAGVGLGAGAMLAQSMVQSLAPAEAAVIKEAPLGDPLVLLEKLGDLLGKGILTKEEFDAKKAELLARIQ